MPNNIDTPFSKGFFGDLFLALLAILIGESISLGLITSTITIEILVTKTLFYLFCTLISLFITKSWQNVWRWTSSDDLIRVAQTIFLASVFYSIIGNFYLSPFSAIEPFLIAFIMASFMMGARGFARLISGGGDFKALVALFRPVVKDAPLAILVGPTDIVTHSLHEVRKNGPLPFRPIAIISTSGNHINKVFASAKVYSGEKIVERIAFSDLTSRFGGEFKLHVFANRIAYAEHITLVEGDITGSEPVLVRVHLQNVVQDVWGRAEPLVETAMRLIEKEGRGVFVLIREPEPQAVSGEILSGKASVPEYGIGSQILSDLGIKNMIVLTNHPKTVTGLDAYGLHIVGHRALDGSF